MNTRRIVAPVVVRSASIVLGAALRERACAGVERTAAKYFGRLNAATVYFSRDGRGYRCTVNIDMGALRIVTGEALGFCCHAVLDTAMRKAAKQLRRLKRSLRDDKLPRSGRMTGSSPARRRSRAPRGRRGETILLADALALGGFRGSGPDGGREADAWPDQPFRGTDGRDRAGAASGDGGSSATGPRKIGQACPARAELDIKPAPEALVGTPGDLP
ncbi:HPF/RaiA family ribosome-associated protein [Methylobacterium radiodurans]|uniref:HPF/RaiA family ribosome-associated protein n=1 Tax=Methylobacterium radiodurans TaxID=2202828 RepID=UPI00194DD75C|nr:HPF/RaiA family ribosome-associated protein [Methylobacterium radiodurans]